MTTVHRAMPDDAESILALQKLAYQSEAKLYNDWSLPPLTETLESLRTYFADTVVLKATLDGCIVGSVRARIRDGICAIGRLVVHPEFQRRGIGTQLLKAIEARCPDVARYELFTGSKSEANIRLYQRLSYVITRSEVVSPTVTLVYLEKAGKSPS